MGTDLPPIPIDPGDLCDICWGDDGELGRVTSRVISMTLYDLEEGEGWEDRFAAELFTPTDLIQDEFLPCQFTQVTANFEWFFVYLEDETFALVSKRFFPGVGAFSTIIGTRCLLSMPNQITDPFGHVAFNGSMSIYLGSA